MFTRLLTQPLTIQTVDANAINSAGDVTKTVTASTDVLGYLEQRTSAEHEQDRDTTTADWTCYLPAGTTIGPTDRVVYGALRFEVVDNPWPVWNPRTAQVHHIEVQLRTEAG